MFCRHNRLTINCPVCQREQAAERRASAPARPPRARAKSGPSTRRPAGLRTKRLERAPDDGYRNGLVPGLRATADAERLAGALGAAAARLEFPGPYPALAEADDPEDATWLAFLLALVGPDAPEVQDALAEAAPRWSEGLPAGLPDGRAQTANEYRSWAGRHGGQVAAIAGEAPWTPARRFQRAFERLAVPGFGRAGRYELLVALGSAGVYDLEAGALHVGGEDDATTTAAKRVLLSGDRMLLERRARDLAAACEVPIAALDRALAVWEQGGGGDDEPPAAAARALGL